MKKASIPSTKHRIGILTGRTLAGFAEVEMAALDGSKHWYPTDELLTEKGEKVVRRRSSSKNRQTTATELRRGRRRIAQPGVKYS